MSSQARRTALTAAIEAYRFADSPEPVSYADWVFPRIGEPGCEKSPTAIAVDDSTPCEDFDLRLAEETRRSFEAGRQQGWQEGRAAERAAFLPGEQHRAEQLGRLFDEFAAERDRFLRAVEQEVVRLALAVAGRILRRESQMDPLLLLGAVRVALGQLASGTEVRLHVPAADVELWKEAIVLLPHPPVRPIVLADDVLPLGACRLEGSLGQVNLGLDAQLGEIEHSFFEQNPAIGDARVKAGRPVELEAAS